ncbi:anti-sigma factor [Aeromicrobium sp.]|uniref:anti-sigma factor n=1 Tax=Aeromicrobium sp. TaxID=1871063 RepID=UPI0030BAEED1
MADMHSLSGAWALNALSERDRESFEEHLNQCEACRAEVAGFARTAARLAEAEARTPPAGARVRLLSAVSTTPQQRPVMIDRGRHQRLRRAIPRLALAAVFAIGMVAAGGFAIERDHARDNRAATDSITSVLAAPDASTKARAFSGGGNVRLVSSAARDVAVIVANDLPALTKGRVYQVWMIKGETAFSQGTFATDHSLIMRQLEKADHVAVTVEPRGGSATPTTLPVVDLAI